jgi:chitin disaccharide deacetylase
VHADDFGETLEITEGICLAIEAGVVTSTSVMVNMPGTAEGLRRASQLARQASFGVHLNLCEGRPLTRGATLTDENGKFLPKRALAANSAQNCDERRNSSSLPRRWLPGFSSSGHGRRG